MSKVKERNDSIFDINGRPPILKCLPLSLQHILAMIVGTVTVPIVVGGALGATTDEITLLVQYALIIAGISTLIQLYPIGNVGAELPIIFGVGFTYVPTILSAGKGYSLASIFGAQLIGGFTAIVIGLSIKRIRKFFPNIVAGTVVFTIGLSLYPIAINYMAGGAGSPNYASLQNWGLAAFTLLVVVGFSQFAKGYVKLAAVFLGIVFGYIMALFMGVIDFSPLTKAGWFAIPIPLAFGLSFDLSVIISMIIISIVNAVQTIGDLSATTMGGMDRSITDKELSNGVVGSGVVTMFGAIFGALPPSSYSQNVGMVSMNKVISRYVLGIAAIFMLLSGFIPKFGALMTTIPRSVLGGATVSIFSMITMTGIKLIISEELSSRNITIVGLAVALGMGITSVPEAQVHFPSFAKLLLGDSPIVISTIVAFVLNIAIPNKSLEEEAKERKAMESKSTN
ncbi:purine permease [Clostridioides mangenotii]|nr:nucleobase:cation symporter-2 family protein [Clostridioides mangenotii]MCR1954228.1 purine permease [Clostridioides mangenotii]